MIGRAGMAIALTLGLVAVTAPTVVQGQASCAAAGYFCAEGADRPVARWPDGRRSLRILLPAPAHEPSSRALRYQQAAARGLMSWHGLPLELLVFEQGDPARMDIVVEWESQLADGRIGETLVATGAAGNDAAFQVVRFVLATQPPQSAILRAQEEAAAAAEETSDELPPLPPEVLDQLSLFTVETTAIHEMGHALGLPHSDSAADVMYPEFSGARLSRRDIATVQAIYAMPVGTRVR